MAIISISKFSVNGRKKYFSANSSRYIKIQALIAADICQR